MMSKPMPAHSAGEVYISRFSLGDSIYIVLLRPVLEVGWDGIPLVLFGGRTLQARVPPTNNWVFSQMRCLFIPVT